MVVYAGMLKTLREQCRESFERRERAARTEPQ